jgi:hypothetical protein
MGINRSIKGAYEERMAKPCTSVSGTWIDWSRHFKWLERAQMYDDHCDRIARESQEEEIKKSAKSHLVAVRNYSQIYNKLQVELMERIRDSRQLQKLSFDDLMEYHLKLSQIITKMQEAEMLALGKEPAKQKVEHSGPNGAAIPVRHIAPAIIRSQSAETDGPSEEADQDLQ